MSENGPALKVFVGYDSREDIAWQVCRHSILRHASGPVQVYPLKQAAVRELGLYTRPYDETSSTEFSLTRFLTPHLAAHEGWTLFVDCDVLFTKDITTLFASLDDEKALYVVQHDYTPAIDMKMDGKKQTVYPRKNWTSFMMLNGAHPHVKALTPTIVNTRSPQFLHRLEWLPDEAIGALPLEWNFLEGEYPIPADTPAAIHFTNGGPWFPEWEKVAYADLWQAERAQLSADAVTQPHIKAA